MSLQQSANHSFFLTSCEQTNRVCSQSLQCLPSQRAQWISWSPVGEKHYRETKNLISPWCLDAVTLRCFLTPISRMQLFSAACQPSFFFSSFQRIINQALNNFLSFVFFQPERSNLVKKKHVWERESSLFNADTSYTFYFNPLFSAPFQTVSSKLWLIGMKDIQNSSINIHRLHINYTSAGDQMCATDVQHYCQFDFNI